MTDSKISNLPSASTPLAGTEVLPIVQSGATVKVNVSDLTSGRSVGMKDLTVTGKALISGANQYSSAKVSVLGDGNNAPLFLNTNGSSNSTKYNAWSISTDNTAYSIKFQVARNTGSYDLGAALRLVNSSGVEYEAVDFRSNGDVAIDVGNLIPGTAAKGINFTANTPAAGMTSQLLNAYEEGTWTPTVIGTSTAGTATYSIRKGYYTRVGRIVNFQLSLAWSGGTGTGNLKISGLPFTSNSDLAGTASIGLIDGVTLTASNFPTVSIDANATTMSIFQSPVGGGAATDVAYDGSGYLIISGAYQV